MYLAEKKKNKKNTKVGEVDAVQNRCGGEERQKWVSKKMLGKEYQRKVSTTYHN